MALTPPPPGANTPAAPGPPAERVHAVQVEIDRGLYLDERSLEPTQGFKRLAADLERLFETLAAQDWSGVVG